MARDTADTTPIESRDQLAAHLESGCKPRETWRIGTEHEKFGFYKDGHAPVPYEGRRGIRALLEGMQALLGWEPIHDGENIIGLADPIGGGAISLEPGGQFELSGAPLKSLHQTCREVHAHLAQVRQIADPLGIGFLGLGMSPKWKLSETPVMPKSRYKIMAELHAEGRQARPRHDVPHLHRAGEPRFFQRSRHARQAARRAGAAADRDRALRQLALHREQAERLPLLPLRDLARHRSATAPACCPSPSLDGFGFEHYVDWALDVPMYFVVRDGRYHDMTNFTFRQFMEGLAPNDLPDPQPTMGDWKNHLSTLFPEVRLKTYLEMRGADGGPWRRLVALPALWVGLLYDQTSLDGAKDLIARLDGGGAAGASRRRAEDGARDAIPQPHCARHRAGRWSALAREGLRRRAVAGNGSPDEAAYLGPLEETLALGRTPAENLIWQYETRWGRSVEPIFEEHVY